MAVLVLGLAPEMPISTYSASSYGAYAIPAAWQEGYNTQNKQPLPEPKMWRKYCRMRVLLVM